MAQKYVTLKQLEELTTKPESKAKMLKMVENWGGHIVIYEDKELREAGC